MYRFCSEGGAKSPTGGSSALGVPDTVDTERTLSALRLNGGGPLGDEPLLFRRRRVSTGEIGCDIGCDMCGRLWLCVCEYETFGGGPVPNGGETLLALPSDMDPICDAPDTC